jgi:hypothetical protein
MLFSDLRCALTAAIDHLGISDEGSLFLMCSMRNDYRWLCYDKVVLWYFFGLFVCDVICLMTSLLLFVLCFLIVCSFIFI